MRRLAIVWAFALLALPMIGSVCEALAQTESPWVAESFVILRSTASYSEARRTAEHASRQLSVKLDLRGLAENDRTGLTFSKEDCGSDGVGDYPCYIARGRWDHGQYLSVEYSSGYKGFKKHLYVVILASGPKGDESLLESLKLARPIFPDAYIKTTDVYLGCMH